MARRTFFSFHYIPDVWRAWVARNSWVISDKKESRGFFDSSVFEAKKRESDESFKAFLRDGLDNTSVTCVLAGTDTADRRWVRYEIARSLVRGNGILTVDINGIKNKEGKTSSRGADPLSKVGVYRTNERIYLAEQKGGKWIKYEDYTLAIPSGDLWFVSPKDNNVVPLSTHCLRYDYCTQDGSKNLGGWIESAAGMAGK